MHDERSTRPALRVIDGSATTDEQAAGDDARGRSITDLAHAARLELARRHSPILHERIVQLAPSPGTQQTTLRAILDDFCPPEIRGLFAAEIAEEVLTEIKRQRKRGPYKRTIDPETGKLKKLRTGFASMPKDKVLAAAKKGGKSVQASGKGYRWRTREEARRAGLKGGNAPHAKRGIHPVNEREVAKAIRKLFAAEKPTSGDAPGKAEAP